MVSVQLRMTAPVQGCKDLTEDLYIPTERTIPLE